ncbi:PIN/TRAM domain-containing protein [Lactococcus formosensis]|jgi:Integral membrane protein (PIN domain superfamily)|uniref:PIN/TRAM domain-containing protein n=1 Tax=Lactococcus formosensis TaxID=1281486 RepID=A0A9Q8Y2P1_9LACT|nr:PIN/TRAM domain-containing protein [Lactococcus formosensis]MCH1722746.1 PIN/TRAM domain-containing protein [Lactococcus formosensis]MCO7179826.1 PIN/TRAM domain-containing protein [Lactococcus formosensis]MDG6110918.1 PIN/TRAM domain-containing protein [Lactococcus formosensis]MDG6113103.1 PIN/TRAM domain-containing protein [Lactococcus formosensis]MDG6114888.1 PIN/TRAM domain-containing protein [Lactococcus formosensis]
MRRWIIHVLMGIVGASLGITTLPWVWHLFRQEGNAFNQEIINGLIGAIIFVILSFFMSNLLMRALKKLDQKITRVNLSKMVFNFIGAILGLTVGVLLTTPLSLLGIPVLSNIISFVLIIGLLYLGYTVFDKRGDEIFKIVFRKRKEVAAVDKPLVKEEVQVQHAMILDTSSVIDGRILDVLKTGFISDKVIVPNFVLLELQLISDSADPLKRAKGRRGLDLVNSLKEFDNVEISNKDYKDIREVDTKLLRYASEISAKLVTNDFNLNKVAEIQGVIVLNINDLANAVKTQLVVGEQIEVTIIREGSERQQGVAYLPDGTMIVIEDTAKMIDQKVLVEVAKVLQTSAGRMIFAELVNAK